jgi:type II secretory pathway pseudopilin PulG
MTASPTVPTRRDGGTTLIELTVALTLMSVFLAMFTAGMVRLYRSADHNDATASAQSRIHIAFQRLDTEIRYAVSISLEGTDPSGSEWFVEYLTTHTGVPVCTQLRLTVDGLLQHRRWDQDAAPPAFATLASGISGTHPFTREAAGVDDYAFERLALSVTASSGGAGRARQINVAFTALNSSLDTSDDAACAGSRPAS